MASASWLERVRAALAPKGYDVVRELASGGMGTVFLARQRTLDMPVAIKIIRPELHTALAVERFRREARTLASLSHSHIVRIHVADEADGMPYYVMDYLEGETLADRLLRGPLAPTAALKLGRDLLAALQAAHERGIVHRDVKPSNVFLLAERAVLTDFGIARRVVAADASTRDREPLTVPGPPAGTPLYMAPEQPRGGEANALSDLYSAALVIYEAYTAEHWFDAARRGWRAWLHVPFLVGRVLRRALAERPQDRWPDARSFRSTLWRTRVVRYVVRTMLLTAGGLVLGATAGPPLIEGMAAVLDRGHGPARIQVARFPTSGLPGEAWAGDSIACALAAALGAYPDLVVRGPCDSPFGWLRRRRTVFEGEVRATGDMMHVIVGPRRGPWRVAASLPAADWRRAAADLAAPVFDSLLGASVLEPSLPRAILPKGAGEKAFLDAEHLFAQARWGEARAAYAAAAALDSTCWLCYWRHAEVGRWFDLKDDPADSARYLAHIGAFPLYYRSLIRAQQLRPAARLDSLDALTARWKDFLFGQFRRGDELLHRGPLVGRSRRDALPSFEEVLKLRPEFGPGLEHEAWLHIAEGDSSAATLALGRRARLGAPLDESFAQLALVRLAYAWRFLAADEAARLTEQLIAAAQAAGVVQLDAGARYLSGFGAPHGQLAFAQRLAQLPGFERSAGIARVLALTSLGRPDTALALARALADRFPELAIFAEELAAATLRFDVDSTRFAAAWPAVQAALEADRDRHLGRADHRRRAAWMLGVVRPVARSGADPAPSGSPAVLLEATVLAARGGYRAALAATERLSGLPAREIEDPFFRAVLHLSRAEWDERAGRRADAQLDLIWHENSDVVGYPTGDPQPAEVDWAFAPLAEWRRARLIEAGGGRPEDACRSYRTVARLWADGEPRYRARADSAARRLLALGCTTAG